VRLRATAGLARTPRRAHRHGRESRHTDVSVLRGSLQSIHLAHRTHASHTAAHDLSRRGTLSLFRHTAQHDLLPRLARVRCLLAAGAGRRAVRALTVRPARLLCVRPRARRQHGTPLCWNASKVSTFGQCSSPVPGRLRLVGRRLRLSPFVWPRRSEAAPLPSSPPSGVDPCLLRA